MDVSIVIVNFKMKDELSRCLPSLFADIEGSGLTADVIVVDNASGDGSVVFIKENFPRVKIIELDSNKGFGAAQNIGLSALEANYYFVLNPDTYFFPGAHTLRKLYEYMQSEAKIGMIGPKITYPDGSLQYSCYRFPTLWHPLFTRTKFGKMQGKKQQERFIMKDFDHLDLRPVDWIMGSAMFIRGEALKQVGKFDERFWMYYEDSDLCRRFWEKHWPVYYVPSIVIEHVHGRKSADVQGVFSAILKNKYARTHIYSWMKYMWKWRNNYRFYHE